MCFKTSASLPVAYKVLFLRYISSDRLEKPAKSTTATKQSNINTFKYLVSCTDGKISVRMGWDDGGKIGKIIN